MDAIVLRSQPTNKAVRWLSRLLLAAPMGISIAFMSQRVLAERQIPELAPLRPVVVTAVEPPPRMIPSLPVQPGLFATRDTKAPERVAMERSQVSRLRAISGIDFDEAGFRGRDGSRFELDGIVVPEQDARCRRLDGVTVSCRERIAARLEILSRGRLIDCQVTALAERATARCLAGKVDLAEDLLRNGLVRKRRDPSDI